MTDDEIKLLRRKSNAKAFINYMKNLHTFKDLGISSVSITNKFRDYNYTLYMVDPTRVRLHAEEINNENNQTI